MSVLLKNRARAVLCVASLCVYAFPAEAVVLIDGKSGRGSVVAYSSCNGVCAEGQMFSSSPSLAYALRRSRAWQQYRRNDMINGWAARSLVAVPLHGSWTAESTNQYSARMNVSRAQAYRLGDRE